jgi:serine/threonine protein kinase
LNVQTHILCIFEGSSGSSFLSSLGTLMSATDCSFDGLEIQNMIADQSGAILYEVKDSESRETYALKIPKTVTPQVEREFSLLKQLSHPFIIPVREIETPNGRGLLMPYAYGGDLFSWIESDPLDESTVKAIIFNILHALVYLHSQHIWHRDIKPENLLVMDYSLSPKCVVLADFGFARHIPEGFCDDEFCGSLQYAARELSRGHRYTEKVDIWALGITMFACLTSALPFDCDQDEIRREILAGLPHLFDGDRLDVSEECRSLIDWMLAPDPAERPSAEQALQHAWFADLWDMKSDTMKSESMDDCSVTVRPWEGRACSI